MTRCMLITGASRGLGLEHARQALAAGERVIATCRDPQRAESLAGLADRYGETLRIEQQDTASLSSTNALATRLEGVAIDMLVNNAGLAGGIFGQDNTQSLERMDYETWREIMDVNVLGVFRTTAALLPNLRLGRDKVVMMMSSDVGSIANNSMGLMHAYRSSKAALNMLTKGLAIELEAEGICVFSMAPGWTRTELGGSGAHWEVDESVRRQRQVMAGIGIGQTGRFINLNGEEVAW